MSAQAFAEAYQAAIYKAAGIAFVLSDQPTGVVLFEGRKFAIITAHNPRSERLSEQENAERHRQLEQDLIALDLEHTPSTGESPDGSWVEEGFAVFDIELDSALELGRKYGQHAILWGEGEKVGLAWCEGGELSGFVQSLLKAGIYEKAYCGCNHHSRWRNPAGSRKGALGIPQRWC